jgi:hypothetical protein
MPGRALAFGLTLAGLLAGCGGSNQVQSDSSIVTGPSNPRVFTADLNALCKQPIVPVSLHRPVTNSELVAFDTRYLAELRALTPSPRQRATYSKFLATAETAVKDLKSGHLRAAVAAAIRVHFLTPSLHAPACRVIVPGWPAGP